MLFINFDQATVTSGYSVFLDKELVAFGKFKHEGEFFRRLVDQKRHVNSIIQEYKDKYPKEEVMVTIEDIQLQQNTGTFKQLAQLQGAVVTGIMEEFELEPQLIHAVSWKSTAQVKGRGRAEQKRNAQFKVEDWFGEKVTQDEADAILIGYWASRQQMNWGRK